MLDFVRRQVADLLVTDQPENIDTNQGFVDLGLDSLMGIELRRRLQRDTRLKLATTFAFDYPNVLAAAEQLQHQLFPEDSAAVATTAPITESGPVNTNGRYAAELKQDRPEQPNG